MTAWTVKKITEPLAIDRDTFPVGCWKCSDPTGRLRSVIEQKSTRRFLLWRIRENTKGVLSLGGADDFHTLAQATDFATNRPGIWGL